MDTPAYGSTKPDPDKPKPSKPKPSKNSDKRNKYNSGSSDSSADAKAKKRAMQSYLFVIYNLYNGRRSFTPKQQKLAEQAWKKKWSASQYAEILRQEDPMYVKTKVYKDRAQEARDLYQTFRPGRPVPNSFINRYAKSNMSKEILQEKIEQTDWFKKEFAGWTEAQKAGSAAGMSPQTYINYRTMWNDALKNAYGQEASPLEQKMMFGSGMTGDEVAKNFIDLLGGQEALRWATGAQMDRAQVIKGALTSKYGRAAINKVQNAGNIQAGFMGTRSKSFDLGVDDLTGNLTASRL